MKMTVKKLVISIMLFGIIFVLNENIANAGNMKWLQTEQREKIQICMLNSG